MSEHVKVLRELREICRAAIEAGDWKIDGACDPDAVLRRADAAIASLSALKPVGDWVLVPMEPTSAMVAEAHTVDTGHGSWPRNAYARMIAASPQPPADQPDPIGEIKQALEGREGWHDLTAKVRRVGDTLLIYGLCATPPAEAQPVGEAGALPGSNGGFTTAVFKASDVPVGTKLYAHPPPSAPVGVEALIADWRDQAKRLRNEVPNLRDGTDKRFVAASDADRAADELEACLAQQPSAAPVGVEALASALQSTRDRMMPVLTAKFGDAFDGDFDVMLEAINALKRLRSSRRPRAPVGVERAGLRRCRRCKRDGDSADCTRCGGTGWRRKCDDLDCVEHGCCGGHTCYVSPEEVAALAQQPAAVDGALWQAARSLRTIADQAGKTEGMEDMQAVRGLRKQSRHRRGSRPRRPAGREIMSITFEQGWGAKRFSEQFPELPKDRAEYLDKLNRAVTRVYLAGLLTDGELDRIRRKRFPKVLAAEINKSQHGGRDDG